MANQVAPIHEKVTIIKTDTGEIRLSNRIIREYLVNGNGTVTDPEISLFIALCDAQKLNPFIKEAHLIKYGTTPATMVVSKDVFQKRADKHPQYVGKKAGIIILTADNKIDYREGGFYIKSAEKIVGGWCEVYRKDRTIPERIEVSFDEYVGTKGDGSINGQWSKKPSTMIRKVAVAQALREAFPQELQGMYSAEEFGEDEAQLNKNPIKVETISTENKVLENTNPFQQAVQQEQIQDDFSMPGME